MGSDSEMNREDKNDVTKEGLGCRNMQKRFQEET